MSDLPFLSLFLVSMLLAERALDPAQRSWIALGAGLAAGLAYLTRTAALPIALTAPVSFLHRRQLLRGLLSLSGMLPTILSWQHWTSTHRLFTSEAALTYYTDYLAWQRATVSLDVLVRVVWHNLDAMVRSLAQLLVFDIAVVESPHFERIIAAGALVGALRLVKQSGRLQYPAAAAGMAAMLLLYHYTPDPRLCLPLLPLILMGFWTEAKRIWGSVCGAWRSQATSGRVGAIAATAILAGGGLFLVASNVVGNTVFIPERYARCRSELAERTAAYEWFRTSTPTEATSYAYDDPVFYLYTGRRALGLTMPYGRIYHADPDGEGNEFARGVPKQAREHGLHYLFLTATDFYREGGQRARLTLDATARDKGFREEFAAGQAVVYRSN